MNGLGRSLARHRAEDHQILTAIEGDPSIISAQWPTPDPGHLTGCTEFIQLRRLVVMDAERQDVALEHRRRDSNPFQLGNHLAKAIEVAALASQTLPLGEETSVGRGVHGFNRLAENRQRPTLEGPQHVRMAPLTVVSPGPEIAIEKLLGSNRDGLREAQQSLIDLAARFTFEDWCRLVRRLAADLDQDGSYDPNDDLDANRLKLSPRGDGTADLAGRLVGDAAATVGQTLESLADDLFHRFRRDAEADPTLPMPCRATLMALALAEACRRALATDVESSKAPGVEATVVIDTDDTGNPVVEDLAGNPISNRAAGALLVDPVVRAMVLDADGVPLRLGRKVRLATPDQRHALALRDRGCVFPGCDAAPGWCDAHHQPGWQHGGTTDIESMFLLCRHHHVVTHRAGWALDGDPERPQHWMWTTPTGRVLASQRQHPSQEHRRTRPG